MPARSRSFEFLPSAATRRRAVSTPPLARAVERAVFDQVGPRLVGAKHIFEAEKMRTELGMQRTVCDLDRGDRLRALLERGPDAEHREQILGRRRKGERASVLFRWSAAGLWIGTRRLGIN